jgi:TonB family protein
MGKTFFIFLLATAAISTQSCSSKPEKEIEAMVAAESSPNEGASVAPIDIARIEKEAREEKEQEELGAKRMEELQDHLWVSLTYEDKKGNTVYNKAEVDPSYEGGNKAMMKYLRENLIFPQSAKDQGLEGFVFVDFVVSASGAVRDVEVTEETSKSVDQSFRSEAIRVVTYMPKWLPGRQYGKNVDVKFSVPITFRMI